MTKQRNILPILSISSVCIVSLVLGYRVPPPLWHTREIIALILFAGAALLGSVCSQKASLTILASVLSLAPILYTQNLWRALTISNASITMMSHLTILATLVYWIGFYHRGYQKIASWVTWCSVMMGIIGLSMRWHASYLVSPDIGHIPIANLYEVLTFFIITTSLLYLLIEESIQQYSLGGFVMVVVSLAALFLTWYSHHRPPVQGISVLVPALQSSWMMLHVPANFMGYGLFSIAALCSAAYLCKKNDHRCVLPSAETIASCIYQSTTAGFIFFTVATILGALWAAETWGSYWQWDPKETWALIVWLNYAAWLHQKRKSTTFTNPLALWSFMSLLVIGFAFLGVNIVLSGLHSYGEL